MLCECYWVMCCWAVLCVIVDCIWCYWQCVDVVPQTPLVLLRIDDAVRASTPLVRSAVNMYFWFLSMFLFLYNITWAFVCCVLCVAVTGMACILSGAWSVKLSGVRPSVSLSVCRSHCSTFAAVDPAGWKYRLIAAWLVLGSSHATALCSSKCGQCHVVSWRRKLNADL